MDLLNGWKSKIRPWYACSEKCVFFGSGHTANIELSPPTRLDTTIGTLNQRQRTVAGEDRDVTAKIIALYTL